MLTKTTWPVPGSCPVKRPVWSRPGACPSHPSRSRSKRLTAASAGKGSCELFPKLKKAGLCFPTSLMLLGVGLGHEPIKSCGPALMQLFRATPRSLNRVTGCRTIRRLKLMIPPCERRHVELPAAPIGFGTLLTNQLHTSSNQTIPAIVPKSAWFCNRQK